MARVKCIFVDDEMSSNNFTEGKIYQCKKVNEDYIDICTEQNGMWGNTPLNGNLYKFEFVEGVVEEMRKEDIKQGMVIEVENGEKYTIVGDIAIDNEGFLNMSGYNEDLTDKYGNNEFDIVKIYDVGEEKYKLVPCNHDDLDEDDIIWTRKEIRGSLYELVREGYKIFRHESWVEGTEEDMEGVLRYVNEQYENDREAGVTTVKELEDLASDKWIGVE